MTYINRLSCRKDVTTENIWTFELVVQIGINAFIRVIKRAMQRGQSNQQHQNNDTFCWTTVIDAQSMKSIQMQE